MEKASLDCPIVNQWICPYTGSLFHTCIKRVSERIKLARILKTAMREPPPFLLKNRIERKETSGNIAAVAAITDRFVFVRTSN